MVFIVSGVFTILIALITDYCKSGSELADGIEMVIRAFSQSGIKCL